jgi:hypothetical protein
VGYTMHFAPTLSSTNHTDLRYRLSSNSMLLLPHEHPHSVTHDLVRQGEFARVRHCFYTRLLTLKVLDSRVNPSLSTRIKPTRTSHQPGGSTLIVSRRRSWHAASRSWRIRRIAAMICLTKRSKESLWFVPHGVGHNASPLRNLSLFGLLADLDLGSSTSAPHCLAFRPCWIQGRAEAANE